MCVKLYLFAKLASTALCCLRDQSSQFKTSYSHSFLEMVSLDSSEKN